MTKDWVGPFTFDLKKNLSRVSDVYGCHGKPGNWELDVYERLSRYLYLGFNEGGDAICLDNADGDKVVFLDHETFQSPTLQGCFINSGLAELMECLLIYSEMLENFWREHGEDTELYEGNVPLEMVEQALASMRHADPKLSVTDGYWFGILDYI